MKEYKWLEKVASHHKEWVKTVQKMGEYDFAEDIVQESYIALMKYAQTRIPPSQSSAFCFSIGFHELVGLPNGECTISGTRHGSLQGPLIPERL